MNIYFKNWSKKFDSELKKTKLLRIISPFVNEETIKEIERCHGLAGFQLVTRLSEKDFAKGVSSLDALRYALEKGAGVFGVKRLHSKVYLFDCRSAIVTSANLTEGGLKNNLECGIRTDDKNVVRLLHNYFDSLKRCGRFLTIADCEKWQKKLSKKRVKTPPDDGFIDHGGEWNEKGRATAYYLKFFGTDEGRVTLDFTSKQELKNSECHYACCYPKKKKPTSVNTGDIVYMARMTRDPRGYSIFGKAEAIKFVAGRDKATQNERDRLRWKKKWPIYLRVKNPIFIDTTMKKCLTLEEVVNELKHLTFKSTNKHFNERKGNIDPMRALMRKAQMELTVEAANMIEEEFQKRIEEHGLVSQKFINSLPKSDIGLTKQES